MLLGQVFSLEFRSAQRPILEVVVSDLRFHYTTKGNFMAICCAAYLTPELWSALKDIDGCADLKHGVVKRRLECSQPLVHFVWHSGVHGLSEEPDQLDTKEIEAIWTFLQLCEVVGP